MGNWETGPLGNCNLIVGPAIALTRTTLLSIIGPQISNASLPFRLNWARLGPLVTAWVPSSPRKTSHDPLPAHCLRRRTCAVCLISFRLLSFVFCTTVLILSAGLLYWTGVGYPLDRAVLVALEAQRRNLSSRNYCSSFRRRSCLSWFRKWLVGSASGP